MNFSHEQRDRVTVVTLKGMLDASSAQTFKNEMFVLIQNNHVNLVIDLKDVGFIDSSGLGSMISALRKVHQEGGDIKLASLQERIRAIFELTRLDKVFEICKDASDAAGRFGVK